MSCPKLQASSTSINLINSLNSLLMDAFQDFLGMRKPTTTSAWERRFSGPQFQGPDNNTLHAMCLFLPRDVLRWATTRVPVLVCNFMNFTSPYIRNCFPRRCPNFALVFVPVPTPSPRLVLRCFHAALQALQVGKTDSGIAVSKSRHPSPPTV